MNKPESSEPKSAAQEKLVACGFDLSKQFDRPDRYCRCEKCKAYYAASPQAVPSEQPIAEQPQSDKANLMVAVGSDLPPALPGSTRRLVTRARRIFRVLEGNETVPTERVMGLLSEMADVLQYGDCSYWCPACYAEVSAPQHPAISMSMFASRADFDAALREASAGAVPTPQRRDAPPGKWKVEMPDGTYTKMPGDPPGPGDVRAVIGGYVYNVEPHSGRLTAASQPAAWRLAACEAVSGEVPSDKKYLPSMTPPAASLPVSAPAGVRMLTDEEIGEVFSMFSEGSSEEEYVAAMIRKFCEVNGLKLAAMSATTKEN